MSVKITNYLTNNSYYTPLWEDMTVDVGYRNPYVDPNTNIRHPNILLNNFSGPDTNHLYIPGYTSTPPEDEYILCNGESGKYANYPSGGDWLIADNALRLLTGYNSEQQYVGGRNYYDLYIKNKGIPFNNWISYLRLLQIDEHYYLNLYLIILLLITAIATWHDNCVDWCYNNSVWTPTGRKAQIKWWSQYYVSDGTQVLDIARFLQIIQTIEEMMIKNNVGKWKHVGNYPPGEIRNTYITNNWYLNLDFLYQRRMSIDSQWSETYSQSHRIYWNTEERRWEITTL